MSDLINRKEFLKRIEPYNTDDKMDKDLYNFAYNKIMDCSSVEPETCGDCISREAAINRFDIVQSDDLRMSYDDIMAFLSSLPSVEPARKKGKWIQYYINPTKAFYYCSECSRSIVVDSIRTIQDYPYCHCGAEMEV